MAARRTSGTPTKTRSTKRETRSEPLTGGNPDIEQELGAILGALKGCFSRRQRASTDKKGGERELFVSACLECILPSGFRFGKGDVCDLGGRKSGAIDIAIENAYMPSLAHPATPRYRHYIAEGVAACIEVKSDLCKQWKEVRDTANKLGRIQRAWGHSVSQGALPQGIPLFAVGFTGWKTVDCIREKVEELSLAGILVLDAEIFVSHPGWAPGADLMPVHTGSWSIWGLSCSLSRFARALRFTSTNPEAYALSHRTMLANILCRHSSAPPPELNLLDLDWLRYEKAQIIQFADKLHEEGLLEHFQTGRVRLNIERVRELDFAGFPIF